MSKLTNDELMVQTIEEFRFKVHEMFTEWNEKFKDIEDFKDKDTEDILAVQICIEACMNTSIFVDSNENKKLGYAILEDAKEGFTSEVEYWTEVANRAEAVQAYKKEEMESEYRKRNPFALLNSEEDPKQFRETTDFLNSVVTELVDFVKPIYTKEYGLPLVAWMFYGELHGRPSRNTHFPEVDTAIKTAVEKIEAFREECDRLGINHGGIGDTDTDEAIADKIDELLGTQPIMYENLCNRK